MAQDSTEKFTILGQELRSLGYRMIVAERHDLYVQIVQFRGFLEREVPDAISTDGRGLAACRS